MINSPGFGRGIISGAVMAKKIIKGRGAFAREVTVIGGAVSDQKAMAEIGEYLRGMASIEERLRDRFLVLDKICRLTIVREGYLIEAGQPPESAAKANMAWWLLEFLSATENRMAEGKASEAVWNAFEAGHQAGLLGVKFTDLEKLADIGRKVKSAGGSKPKGDKAEVRRLWQKHRDAYPNLSLDQCDRAIGTALGLSGDTVRRYRLAK